MTREASSDRRNFRGFGFRIVMLAFFRAGLGRCTARLLRRGAVRSLAVLQPGARASACILHAGGQFAQTRTWRGFRLVRELRELLRAGLSTRLRNSLRCRRSVGPCDSTDPAADYRMSTAQ